MAKIDPIRGDAPNDPNLVLTVPGYSLRRGKVTPPARAAWGATGGMGQTLDAEGGKRILDDALGD